MKNDLKKSGIKPASIKKLKTKQLNNEQTKKLTGYSVPSYKIPYFDFNGKQTDYYRLKFLETPKVFGQELKQKYWQEQNSQATIYTAPLLDWSKIINDVDIPLTITEGEKKSALLCQYEIATIGLGGVWSFKSKKNHQSFLPILEEIEWQDREVDIVFDNDVRSNPQVHHAMVSLSTELVKRGAFVNIVYLPDVEEKIGIDDYLLKYTTKTDVVEAYNNLEAEEFITSVELHKINTESVFIHAHNQYYIPDKKVFIKSPAQGSQTLYATRNYTIPNINPERPDTRVNAFKQWCEWQHRKEVSCLVYEPDESKVEKSQLNLFTGLGVEPEKGDIKPFLNLFNLLFGDLSADTQKWVWQWLAYPLQNKGTKLYSALVLSTRKQGYGKSLLGLIMGKIYGDNFSEVNHAQLDSEFNAWAQQKMFALADEVLDSGNRKQADKIKNLITQESVTVNQKGEKAYQIRDCINYIFTSNHVDAMYITKDDRRYFIHTPKNEKETPEFYAVIDKWKDNGGPAALLHHLLMNVDCSSFNPKAAPPATESKEEMLFSSSSDIGQWCLDLHQNADVMLQVGGVKIKKDLFTASQLVEFYMDLNPTNKYISSKVLRRALDDVAEWPRRNQVRTAHGAQRLIAVRNFELWGRASPREWGQHYDEFNKTTVKRESKAVAPRKKSTKKVKADVVPINKSKK